MSEHYCKSPWMSLFVYNDGKVKSCCAGQWDWGDLKTQSLDEIINDPKVIQLKQDILDGTPNPYCSYCAGCEENSGSSQRGYYTQFPMEEEKLYDPTVFELMQTDIRWNNLCNLNCAYCDTLWSTTWAKLKDYPIVAIKSRYYDSVLTKVSVNKDNMKAIIMGGGEPLLHKQNVELLQALNDDIKIDIMTNLSMNLDSVSVFAEIRKKTDVNWCISFENVGDEFEFVRHGAKWDQLYENIKRIRYHPGHCVMLKPTYNLLSATNLTKLYEIANEFKVPVSWQTLIHPPQLCVNNFSKPVRDFCSNRIKEFLETDVWKEYLTINPHSFGHDFLSFIASELDADRDESNPSDLVFRQWSKEYTIKYAPDVKKFHELWPELDELIMKEKNYELA